MTAGARARTAIAAGNQAGTPTISQALDGHVTLEVECLDRVYLNAYVPRLQVGGQVVGFLVEHLGNPIPSPALFARIGERFRGAVACYAKANGIPVVRFEKGLFSCFRGCLSGGYVTARRSLSTVPAV